MIMKPLSWDEFTKLCAAVCESAGEVKAPMYRGVFKRMPGKRRQKYVKVHTTPKERDQYRANMAKVVERADTFKFIGSADRDTWHEVNQTWLEYDSAVTRIVPNCPAKERAHEHEDLLADAVMTALEFVGIFGEMNFATEEAGHHLIKKSVAKRR